MRDISALIVDHSEGTRKLVERALRQAGLSMKKVLEAASGAEALALIGCEQVDLILTDITLPEMDGLEFLRQLRDHNSASAIPVVMITTDSSEAHVREAIAAGAQGYIRKPFTAEQVKERVLPLIDFL